PAVILRNAAPRRRSGVALIDVEEFVAHVAVGFGYALTPEEVRIVQTRIPRIPPLGRVQPLSKATRYSRIESPRHYPDNDLIIVHRVAAWVSNAAPYGIMALPIGAGKRRTGAPDSVVAKRASLRNAHLSI